MEYQLTVDRYDLSEGLKHFEIRRKVRPSQKAILGFDGRFFSMEALDRVIVAKAEGTWPGIAYVSATFVVALARVPLAVDSVVVTCDGERLRLGPLTVSCTWQPVSHTLLKLPAAPDWVEALSLKYRARRSQILTDGYEFDIENAERKLTKLIIRVAKPLAPLGVTEQDIRSLIEGRLAERYAGRG